MTDNIIRPPQWLDNGQQSLNRTLTDPGVPDPIEPGGGGPHDPGMEARVSALEAAFADMRITLARIDERTSTLATKEDVAGLTERLSAQGQRIGAVEDALKVTVASALSKTIGVGGGIALFAGMGVVVVAALGALRYFGFLHG